MSYDVVSLKLDSDSFLVLIEWIGYIIVINAYDIPIIGRKSREVEIG